MFESLRVWLIWRLSGTMPIMVNMRVNRPEGYTGPLVVLNKKGPGLFSKNLIGEPVREAVIETRDLPEYTP